MGCVLVGLKKDWVGVYDSRRALNKLKTLAGEGFTWALTKET
jgi:hypothetical protein